MCADLKACEFVDIGTFFSREKDFFFNRIFLSPPPLPCFLSLSPPVSVSPQEGERKGVSPEEVYAGVRGSGDSSVVPSDWLKAELPPLLDEICARAALAPPGPRALQPELAERADGSLEPLSRGVQLSRAEAKQAWLTAGGDTERAVKQALRERKAKVSPAAKAHRPYHWQGFSVLTGNVNMDHPRCHKYLTIKPVSADVQVGCQCTRNMFSE